MFCVDCRNYKQNEYPIRPGMPPRHECVSEQLMELDLVTGKLKPGPIEYLDCHWQRSERVGAETCGTNARWWTPADVAK